MMLKKMPMESMVATDRETFLFSEGNGEKKSGVGREA
jgi:hypothetical protein